MKTLIEKRLEGFSKALKNIPIESFFLKIAEQNKAIIEDKNSEQLDQGVDGEGSKIEPPYTDFTVSIKKALGRPFDRVTLEDTGAFRKGIKSQASLSGLELSGTEKKTGLLTEKYGEVIGLNKKSIGELNEDLFKPELMEEIKRYLKEKI